MSTIKLFTTLLFTVCFFSLTAIHSITNIEKVHSNEYIVSHGATEIQDSCDLVVLKGGEELYVQVIEVTDNVIKYNKCGVLNSPLYVKTYQEVYKIAYSSGEEKIINEENNPANIEIETYESDDSQGAWAKGFIAGIGLTTLGFIISGVFNGLAGVSFLPTLLIIVLTAAVGLIGISYMKKGKSIFSYLKGWLTGLLILITVFLVSFFVNNM